MKSKNYRPVRPVPYKITPNGPSGLSITISKLTEAQLGDYYNQYVKDDGTIVLEPVK